MCYGPRNGAKVQQPGKLSLVSPRLASPKEVSMDCLDVRQSSDHVTSLAVHPSGCLSTFLPRPYFVFRFLSPSAAVATLGS